MRVFAIVDNLGTPRITTMFSTRERAERELLDDDLGEEDGYFIQEWELSEEAYFKLLAEEAREDDEKDDLMLGGES
jgi:hypothetical protein